MLGNSDLRLFRRACGERLQLAQELFRARTAVAHIYVSTERTLDSGLYGSDSA